MDHFCTRTARRRVVAMLAAGGVLVTLAAMPPVSAQDLGDRKERITQEIDRSEAQLDQSSAQLVTATGDLKNAEVRLSRARNTLAQTRGELAAAQALDSRMQAELAAAVRDLDRARTELVHTRGRVREQEALLGRIAVATYESGDPALMGLSMVLTTQDTVQLASQLSSVRSVLDKEAVTLDRLEASRVILAVRRATFEEARLVVARQRAAAAANLERKQLLESRAENAEASIEELVAVRSQAREAAAEAKTEDLRRLADLEVERERISELLQRRAEAARRRAAAAAAAAAAEAEARAEARAAREAARDAAQARDRKPVRHHLAPAPAPSPPSNELLYPVDGYVTSSYGMRFHPVYRRWSLHDGTDFGASCGTPVRAAASGTVIAAYYNSAYGNRVIIDHGYRRGVGLGTSYNHLSAYSTYVGQDVQRGDVIGYVGTTGFSTGCHLHFMVFENGATVDPMTWL